MLEITAVAIVLDDVKSYNTIKGFVNYYIYALTTVEARVLYKLYSTFITRW